MLQSNRERRGKLKFVPCSLTAVCCSWLVAMTTRNFTSNFARQFRYGWYIHVYDVYVVSMIMRIFSRLGLFEKAEVVLEEKLKDNPYYPFERVEQNVDSADHQVDFADEDLGEDEKPGWDKHYNN